MFATARKILRSGLKVGSLEILAQALAMALTVLKFRFFRAEVVGILTYFYALAELPSAFYADFNRLVSRFAPGAADRRKAEILLVAGSVQLAILGAFVLAALTVQFAFPSLRFWDNHAASAGVDLAFAFLIVVATAPLALLRSILCGILASYGRYSAIQLINLATTVAGVALMGAIMAAAPGLAAGVKAFLLGQWAIAWFPVAAVAAVLGTRTTVLTELARIRPGEWPAVFASVWAEHVRNYTLPLQLASILAYLKENLAVLFMGQSGMMAGAGLYGVANRLYVIPRKFIPNLVQFMMPKLVVSMERDPAEFRRKYDVFSWMQFWAHVGMGTIILACFPLLGRLFAFPGDSTLPFVFFLFSVNLAISSIAQVNHNLIMLGKDTWWQLVSSLLRMAVVTALTLLLVPAFGPLGAALALVASSLAVTLSLAYDTRKTALWTWNNNLYQLACCMAVAVAWGAMIACFGMGIPDAW